MPKNYLLIYSEQLATEIELLCQNIKAPPNKNRNSDTKGLRFLFLCGIMIMYKGGGIYE